MSKLPLESIKRISSNRVVNNAKWMIAEQLIQMIISFVIGMITARYLGPSNYGIINYCAAYVAFFTSVALLGIEAIVVKELVSAPEREGEILGSAILMRFLAGALSMVTILIILFFVDDGNVLVLKVGFLQSLILVFKAFEVFDYWFQSKLQSKYSSLLKSVSYFMVAAYKVFILVTGKSVEWFAFSTSLDFLIIAILLSTAYKKMGGAHLSFSRDMSKRLISQGYHFMISALVITVYAQMDKIMIKHFLNETEVGLYSAAIVICTYWVLIPTAIINSVRPSIMELKKSGDEERYKRRLKQLYSLLMWMGIAVSGLVSLLSGFIIKVAYGNDYAAAATSLAIAIWYTTFSTLGVARGNWLVCEDKSRYNKWFVSIGAVVNLILNFIMIPRMGIEGAALATLITQITVSFISPLFFKATRENTKDFLEALAFRF